jgi:hypothetical protein
MHNDLMRLACDLKEVVETHISRVAETMSSHLPPELCSQLTPLKRAESRAIDIIVLLLLRFTHLKKDENIKAHQWKQQQNPEGTFLLHALRV